jgi:predicted 2-oxoglutarate/Fe(II)-dependent dioxygenase YbiX
MEIRQTAAPERARLADSDAIMTAEEERLRDKIRVTDGFIGRDLCETVVHAVDPSMLVDAVVDGDDPSQHGRVDKEVRNVLVHSARSVGHLVNEALQRIVDELIEPLYEVQIDYWEHPDILVYPPGGFYVLHNDGESVVHDPEQFIWEWRRTVDRDISVVWYLNDDFEGGELVFPRFQLSIRPRTGTVVTFPSTRDYPHATNPVARGMRFAIATWMAAVGTPRVQDPPPPRVHSRAWSR